ncbi:MAG: fibronectin type III domain-containing protein [Clostridia bacterium]|nr:fibronectin type III domain-containing protein [Clostridia bacterium]
MNRRRVLSILLCLALAVGLTPVLSLTAFAASQNVITGSSTTWSGDSTINSDEVKINSEVTVNADMTLTIPTGCKLTVTGGINAKDKTLTITGTGTLVVEGVKSNTGVMGDAVYGNIIVNGASFEAYGYRRGVRGNLTVNSGFAWLYGGEGTTNSSTGTGVNGSEAIWGNVTVKDGMVTLNGGKGGPGTTSNAGVGGRGVFGNVTVEGGEITVSAGNGGDTNNGSGGNGGVGISGSLTVNGGKAEVTGGKGGNGSSGGKIARAVQGTISAAAAKESDDGKSWSAIASDKSEKQYVSTLNVIAVTGVTLNPSAAQTTNAGEKVSFTATVQPNDASDKKVKWSVGGDDPSAVTLYSDEACKTQVGTDATDVLTVYAMGNAQGSATVTVTSNANSAKTASCTVTVNKPASVVTKAPAANTLTYTGSAQALVTAGEATGGAMQYALGTKDAATGEYSATIPTATDVGTYYVWYKVIGDESHANTDPASVEVTISPADKTALNAAIDSAAKYGDNIKDYSEIVATLNTAIEAARAVAANDNAAPDAIADAVTKLNTAAEAAKAAVEAAKNQAAAQAVIDAIKALPEPATPANKDAVAEARKAYDTLTDAQKALVPADVLKKLTDAEAAVAATEKTATDAEKDAAAAQAVTDAIKALPESPTLNDKAAVEAARKAYDALTDAQKALVPVETVKKLTDAEAAIAAAEMISLRKCTITAEDRIFTGKAITPRVTVMYGDTKLKEGQDYTLSYKKVKTFQKVQVVVEGKGRFKGTRNAYFNIVPKGTAITKATGGRKQFTVKWKKQKNITGFQIEYSLHRDFANSTKMYIRSDSTLSATVKKLKSGRTYYVRVRTYNKRKNRLFFSAWSEAVTVNTNGAKANEAQVINIAVNVGDELDLNALATGVTTWESSDEAVATVSAEGIAQALMAGEATFTGFDANGDEIKIVMLVSDSATLELEAIDLTDFGGGIVEDIDTDEPLPTEEELELTLE